MTQERLSTGVKGLDEITLGGFVRGGIYLVIGRPGAGKSILGNQISFAHAKRGGRTVYATLLAETHARLLSQIRQLSFFDEQAIGHSIVYLNALTALDAGGLDGLLKALQSMVREQKADVLVLDGLLPPAQLGVDDLTYKKFVAALQSWVGVLDCTVFVLRTGSLEANSSAEQTMVDGIVELDFEQTRMRLRRRLSVTKLRGSAFVDGKHAYCITRDGMDLYPRVELSLPTDDGVQPLDERVPSGVPGLDSIMGGALVRGSSTLVLGSSGAGKTTLGLQFALEGARLGEPTLFYGFFEPPHALRHKAARLGFLTEELEARGLLAFAWRSSAEVLLDRELHDLLALITRTKARRLVLDGFPGFRSADETERLSPAFAAVSNLLSRAGVTSMVTDEARELYVHDVHIPTSNVSALFHNILFVRHVERGAELLRLVSVMKTRDTSHDRRLYQFDIDDKGVRILAPFASTEHGLIRGGGVPDA